MSITPEQLAEQKEINRQVNTYSYVQSATKDLVRQLATLKTEAATVDAIPSEFGIDLDDALAKVQSALTKLG